MEGVYRETVMDSVTPENFKKIVLILGACGIATVLVNTQNLIKNIANSDQAGALFDLLDTNRPGRWLIKKGQKIHAAFEIPPSNNDTIIDQDDNQEF